MGKTLYYEPTYKNIIHFQTYFFCVRKAFHRCDFIPAAATDVADVDASLTSCQESATKFHNKNREARKC